MASNSTMTQHESLSNDIYDMEVRGMEMSDVLKSVVAELNGMTQKCQ